MTQKTQPAKKATPAKKAESAKPAAAQKKAEPAKKATPAQPAKKAEPAAPAKKEPKKVTSSKGKSFGGGLKAGDSLMVKVDPRGNNGADFAAATVTRVLNVEGENRVNLVAFLDGNGTPTLRNVLVLDKEPTKKDAEDAPTVFALRS